MSDCERKPTEEMTKEESMKFRVDKLEYRVNDLERQGAYQSGMIDGLKFALRCNGISGGEVR